MGVKLGDLKLLNVVSRLCINLKDISKWNLGLT